MSDVVIGAKIQLDGAEAQNTLKSIKTRIREATSEVIMMSEKFGSTSKEALNAARHLAKVKDELADARQLADAFNPDQKFKLLTQSLNGALGGFTALTGAMGLLGVESESVQKQLLKVQSAMALSQGLNQIGDSILSFKTLGNTIVNTLGKGGAVGLAIAGVTALGLAVAGVFSKKQTEDAKAYKDTLKDFTAGAADAQKQVNKVKDAFNDARLGIISKDDALKLYNDTLGKTIGGAKSINEAERILANNAEAYVKITGWKAQANAMLAISAQKSAEHIVKMMEFEKETAGMPSFVANAFKKQLAEEEKGIAAIERRANDMMLGIQMFQKRYNFQDPAQGVTTGGNSVGKTAAVLEKEKENDWLKQLHNKLAEEEKVRREKEAEQRKIQMEEDFAAAREMQNGLTLINSEGINERLAAQAATTEAATANESQQAAARIAIAENEARAKIMTQQLLANTLSVFSDLVGKETAAGKVLAIASATINTYLAATAALKADYSMYGPAAQFARVAAVVSTIALGLKQVREIVKVKVPGAGSGGSSVSMSTTSSASVSAPIQAVAPQSTRTRLEQDQINQIGNATVRAFVVESDVTSNQERIRRLNRAARI